GSLVRPQREVVSALPRPDAGALPERRRRPQRRAAGADAAAFGGSAVAGDAFHARPAGARDRGAAGTAAVGARSDEERDLAEAAGGARDAALAVARAPARHRRRAAARGGGVLAD